MRVTPHHFTLTDTDVHDYDANFKMNPPLRSAADREALLVALADGTVDAIATDHAPHAMQEKCIEFERAAFGITGLETAVGLAITRLHREHKIPLTRIVGALYGRSSPRAGSPRTRHPCPRQPCRCHYLRPQPPLDV